MLTREQAEILKQDIAHKPIYNAAVGYLLEGPVTYMQVSGKNAVSKVRLICGHTDPSQASPGTIRGDFATGNMQELCEEGMAVRNVIHSSKDKCAAQQELRRVYGDNI